MLSSDEEDVSGTNALTVNRKFADRYDNSRRRAELSRAKAMGLLDSDSESETEDEGQALTPVKDLEILRTLQMVRERDPRIYDTSTQFYRDAGKGSGDEEEQDGDGSDGSQGRAAAEPSSKRKITVRSLATHHLLTEGKLGSDSEEDEDEGPGARGKRGKKGQGLEASRENVESTFAYDEEQRKLRAEFLAMTGADGEEGKKRKKDKKDKKDKKGKVKKGRDAEAADAGDSGSEDGDVEGLLRIRSKGASAAGGDDDNELAAGAAGVEGLLEKPEVASRFAPDEKEAIKRFVRRDPQAVADSDEAFLRDFVLNQRWKDDDDALPTYDDVVGDISERMESGRESRRDRYRARAAEAGAGEAEGEEDEEEEEEEEDGDDADLSDLERAEDFERTVNFRFEEEGGTQLTSYARGAVEGSLRRRKTTRKEARERRKERKEEERRRVEEELRRLKNLKRQELERKLKDLTAEAGVRGGFTEADVEGDWDPEAHERRMAELFNDDYYEGDEGDDWRPEVEGAAGGAGEGEEGAEEGDEAVPGEWVDPDALGEEEEEEGEDADGGEEEGEGEGAEEGEEEEEEEEVPAAVREARAKLMDELHALDHEDIVGGERTRFKYRQVPGNSYGLTAEQILFMDDNDLKEYVSLKRMRPYMEREWRPQRSARSWLNRKWKDKLRELLAERKRAAKRAEHRRDQRTAAREKRRKGGKSRGEGGEGEGGEGEGEGEQRTGASREAAGEGGRKERKDRKREKGAREEQRGEEAGRAAAGTGAGAAGGAESAAQGAGAEQAEPGDGAKRKGTRRKRKSGKGEQRGAADGEAEEAATRGGVGDGSQAAAKRASQEAPSKRERAPQPAGDDAAEDGDAAAEGEAGPEQKRRKRGGNKENRKLRKLEAKTGLTKDRLAAYGLA